MPGFKLNNAAIIAIAIAIIVVAVYFYTMRPTGFRTVSGRDIAGYDLGGMPINGISEKQCAEMCMNRSDCNMYGYRSSDKKCWLKTPRLSSGMTFGIKK